MIVQNRLLKWARTELAPHGVSMEVVLAKIYRAHWEDLHKTEDERQHYGERAGAAKQGLMLLLAEPNCDVRMIDQADWQCLLTSLTTLLVLSVAQRAQHGTD